ncbi:MAG: hypothetical protein EXS31_00615 [Pedosphaera sp.]|nr:hypothetical protein [Pedosphaera sp.]
MKSNFLWASSLALGLGALTCYADDPATVEKLQQQLQQMQENFNRTVREQQTQIEALKKQLDQIQRKESIQPKGTIPSSPPSVAVPSAPASGSETKPWSPTDPIRVGGRSAYVDLSMVGTFAAGTSTAHDIEGGTQMGGHDPNQRGFTTQGVELNLQGAVDPYFRGNANILFQLDSGGESFVELEEAWLETVSLPANLQLRAGQYLTEFGRLNTQHPHSWGFVDAPLVNGRLLGEDGVRNPGIRLSWLVPTPFYSELFVGVQNSQGGTSDSFRSDHAGEPFLGRIWEERGVGSLGDMLYSTRYAMSFDLSDTQTLLGGVSAIFGPNSTGGNTDTQIYGADVYWKWKPATAHAGFPFVSWQTEAILRRLQAGAFRNDFNGSGTLDAGEDVFGDGLIHTAPREGLTNWGLYSQLLYGFREGWVGGLRGDYVGRTRRASYELAYGDDSDRLSRWRISPNLTWYPSEFSKIRLQYNYDDRDKIGVDHSVWLQFELLLGAHAAHKF